VITTPNAEYNSVFETLPAGNSAIEIIASSGRDRSLSSGRGQWQGDMATRLGFSRSDRKTRNGALRRRWLSFPDRNLPHEDRHP
jgi:hypothetical protein